jgi:hypothetical protein
MAVSTNPRNTFLTRAVHQNYLTELFCEAYFFPPLLFLHLPSLLASSHAVFTHLPLPLSCDTKVTAHDACSAAKARRGAFAVTPREAEGGGSRAVT